MVCNLSVASSRVSGLEGFGYRYDGEKIVWYVRRRDSGSLLAEGLGDCGS